MRRFLALVLLVLAACASAGGDTTQPLPLQTTETTSPSPSPTPSETQVEPPPPGEPTLLRFAVLGDFGTGGTEQYQVADRMCSWRANNPFNLVITTGDNIYQYGEPENFDTHFFQPYDCLLDAGVRFRAVLGNHDIGTDNGRPELEEPAFGMKRRNYVVRKNGVRFVMWESNYSNRDWLRRNVGAERGDRWTVVSFHHPVFSPGPHGGTPEYKPWLPRLFARKGVDLVVNGHDHLYARIPSKRRVRYLITGGGGAGLYGCDNPQSTEVCIEEHHFLYVTVTADEMVVRAIPRSGGPIDTVVVQGRP